MSKVIFYEIQLPPEIAYGSSGGPEFFTDIVTSGSGLEQRSINWLQARARYNLAPAIKTKAQLEYLIKFFRLCHGKAIGFRFKDWTDYKIEKQLIAIGDGKNCEFQLIKNYSIAEFKFIRKITKPVKVKIYCEGLLVETEIDYATGIIKFTKPPKGKIYAEAEFDVPVRFDIDHLNFSIETANSFAHHEIPLVEIKL